MPLQLRDKCDFIPELTINAQRLRAKSVEHPFSPLASRWNPHPDPNPSSSILQAQISKWRIKNKLSW
jgi:fibronectin type 3 domain-containing protein